MNPNHTPALAVSEEPTVQRSFILYESQLRHLEAIARRDQRSVSFVLRDLIAKRLAPESR